MKCPLFDFPSYRYEIDDWESKKKELLKQIDTRGLDETDLRDFKGLENFDYKLFEKEDLPSGYIQKEITTV